MERHIISMRSVGDADGNPAVTRAFGLQVSLGQSCDFRCEYCSQGDHDNTRLEQEKARDALLCRRINDRLSGYIASATGGRMDPCVSFIGGEPSLYPVSGYLDILGRTLRPRAVRLITNLGAPARWYEDVARKCRLDIVASCHPSQYPLDKFEEKCLEVMEDAADELAVQFTLTGKNTDEYLKIKAFAKEHGIQLLPRLERHMREDGSYSVIPVPEGAGLDAEKAYRATWSDGTQEFLPALCNMPGFSPRGYACSIARDSLLVRHDGSLLLNLPCRSARNRIGNLLEGPEPFVFDGSPVTCENDYCSCRAPRWLRRDA